MSTRPLGHGSKRRQRLSLRTSSEVEDTAPSPKGNGRKDREDEEIGTAADLNSLGSLVELIF